MWSGFLKIWLLIPEGCAQSKEENARQKLDVLLCSSLESHATLRPSHSIGWESQKHLRRFWERKQTPPLDGGMLIPTVKSCGTWYMLVQQPMENTTRHKGLLFLCIFQTQPNQGNATLREACLTASVSLRMPISLWPYLPNTGLIWSEKVH